MNFFVVGSGRCGSTLLTNMLAKHPELLVISEFFATSDRNECFSKESVSGKQFAEFLSRSHPFADIGIRRSKTTKEMMTDTKGLYSLPALLISTLPMISSDPEKLFKEALEVASKFPVQRYLDHYNAFFNWLMQKNGKQFWVERSGCSNEYLPQLIELFP